MPAKKSDSVDAAKQIDTLCDRFESEWRAGKRPRIEEFLMAAPEELRAALFEALLPVELELLAKKGPAPAQADYRKRFPQQAGVITRVFRERAEKVSAGETTVSRVSVRSSPAAPAKDVPVPAKIGRFKVLSVLGQGAFGSVYRARDPQLQRDVAIKVPRPGSFATDQERERFLREARAAAAVQHPNICPIYEVNSETDVLYIVMAYVAGASLADYLQSRKNSLTPKQSAVIVRKLALALHAAHAKGIVHRDLKPANILFDRERQDVIVTDFGLARLTTSDDVELTHEGAIMGTPAYMSPEQARGNSKNVGPAADIFSLGVILYELLTGVRPFTGSMGEILGKVQHVEPERPSKLRAGIDASLEKICLKALAKSPADRFKSMREFADQLGEYLKGAPSAAIAEGTPGPTKKAEVSDSAQMAEIIAAMSLERKADTKKLEQSQRGLARTILAVGGCLGVLLVLTICAGGGIGVWLYFRSDPVGGGPTVSVTLQNITHLHDNSVHYWLDGKKVDSKQLEGPLKLALGEHTLEGKRGDEIVEKRLFNVDQEDDQKEIVAVPAEPDGPAGLVHEMKNPGNFNVSSVAVSPDGRWVMVVHSGFSRFDFRSSSVVVLWELKSRTKIHAEAIANAELVAFGPKSKHPYVGFRGVGERPFVLEYELSNPKRWKDLRRFVNDAGGYTTACLDLSQDGRYLLRGTQTNLDPIVELAIWDTRDGNRLIAAPGLALGCLTPDGTHFFAAKGNELIMHEIRNGKANPLQTYKGHTSPITCVACSQDGRHVAAGTGDPSNAVRVWEVESGKALDHFARHSSHLTSVRFSPDGKRLLTAATDGILRVSSVRTGDEIHVTPAQGAPITCAVFTPGGRHAVFGLSDGNVKLWRLPK